LNVSLERSPGGSLSLEPCVARSTTRSRLWSG
jgi:hypothetical protein